MSNDYNSIAKIYDGLSRVVYQKSIVKAQVFLIQLIKDNDSILIVGGGTGWILEEIAKLQRQNLSVVYVEKSSGMIKLAQKRNITGLKTTFIQNGIETFDANEKFDVIITAFLFDNFKKEKIEFVFAKLNGYLKNHGIWLYADFVNDRSNKKVWQQFLLKSMYTFFRITAGIETQELIDMQPYFAPGYELITEQFYYNHFIQAKAYRKRN
jgi:ubiquinone/menaquinone biosynthesis C-methylase UbiE